MSLLGGQWPVLVFCAMGEFHSELSDAVVFCVMGGFHSELSDAVVFCVMGGFHFELSDAVGVIYAHRDQYKHEQSEEVDYLQVI